jgi:putative transposase
MQYRRTKVSGGTYFFTINLANRYSALHTERVDVLRDTVRINPFDILAWVVLPEHMHTIWTMPVDDADYSRRWMLIKQRFSRAIGRTLETAPSDCTRVSAKSGSDDSGSIT